MATPFLLRGTHFQHGELFPHMSVLENLLVARDSWAAGSRTRFSFPP
jgi:ABC-type polar amino acid transport system ATPase subunit